MKAAYPDNVLYEKLDDKWDFVRAVTSDGTFDGFIDNTLGDYIPVI